MRNRHNREHVRVAKKFETLYANEDTVFFTDEHIEETGRSPDGFPEPVDIQALISEFIRRNRESIISINIERDIRLLGALFIRPRNDDIKNLNFLLLNLSNAVMPALLLEDCNIKEINSASKSFNINKCDIGQIEVEDDCNIFYAENSYIGSLNFRKNISKIHLKNCFVGDIAFGKVSEVNLVTLENTSLAANKSEDAFFGPLSHLRTFLAFLENNHSSDAAHYVRGRLLRAEHCEARGVMKFVSWFYGGFADYGLKPERALWCLFIMGLAVVAIGTCTHGAVVNTELLSDNGSWHSYLDYPWFASGYLAIKTLLNPFSIFDSRSLVVPNIWTLGAMFVQAVMNVGLFTVIALSVRRRFKIGS